MLIWGIQGYRLAISPAKGFVFGQSGQCRFSPSCSAYAMEAVRVHGALAGSFMAARRLARCHPWGGCGHDPVPPAAAVKKEIL